MKWEGADGVNEVEVEYCRFVRGAEGRVWEGAPGDGKGAGAGAEGGGRTPAETPVAAGAGA